MPQPPPHKIQHTTYKNVWWSYDDSYNIILFLRLMFTLTSEHGTSFVKVNFGFKVLNGGNEAFQ